uniref:MACPF domain-containing protein n=1 Tax=Vitis vinifera TaxID=29760 RepID=A5B4D4_VITVI|nr:hypothetical protein VITISV_013258 [Vitis vinifera]
MLGGCTQIVGKDLDSSGALHMKKIYMFIEKFGTHVIVGVKMGGKDTVYVKQLYSSTLQPTEVQKQLKDIADKRFSDAPGSYGKVSREKFEIKEHGMPFMDTSTSSAYSNKESQDITFISKRRGGSSKTNLPHSAWIPTVSFEPDVISMSLVPITSLLSGIDGSGFLTHAINLYLRYKPPIEELHQFLEFQLPKQWAPVFGDLAVGPETKQQSNSSLRFSLMGPKLYVNTTPEQEWIKLGWTEARSTCLGGLFTSQRMAWLLWLSKLCTIRDACLGYGLTVKRSLQWMGEGGKMILYLPLKR